MTRISDLIESNILMIGDGYRAKNIELSFTGIPFARCGNIQADFEFKDCDYFPLETLEKVGEKISVVNDVVFTSKGTVGRFAFVRPSTPRFVYSPQLCYWRVLNCSIINPRYLYYWMVGPEFSTQCTAVKGQTDMADYVSLTEQRRMSIDFPSLSTQNGIAHILGTLDDKIELNRRMNETLESIARAIFTSWFIDFNPVRAKAEGRQPEGMDEETAALFPSEFEEGGGQEIPKGWAFSFIGDNGEVICGKTPSTAVAHYYNNDFPFITIPDMHNSIFITETQKKLSFLGKESQEKKTVPPFSICVSCIATPGLVSLTTVYSQTNQQINTVIPYLRGSSFFYYYTLKQISEEIIAKGKGGSVISNLNKAEFLKIEILTPPDELKLLFNREILSLFRKILNNIQESQILSDTRDTLLPKLLSGELRIENPELFTGAT